MSSCSDTDVRAQLVALYTKLAEQPNADFGWGKGKSNAHQLGYAKEWLECLPDVIWESAAAVGNPFSLGEINQDETVLDIGCGAGADTCIAALHVGSRGRVIGIDCTPAMIAKARANAQQAALENVEFLEADFSALPISDNTVDVVISNGAINLASNKHKVFKEIFRVMNPGGRLQIADMIRDLQECCPSDSNGESWADCVQGTLQADYLLEVISGAGFINAELVELTGYRTSASTNGALIRAVRPK